MACGRLFRTITGVRLNAPDRHEVRTVGLPTIRGRHSNRPAMFVTNRGRALRPRELSFGHHATAQHLAIHSAGAGSGRRKPPESQRLFTEPTPQSRSKLPPRPAVKPR